VEQIEDDEYAPVRVESFDEEAQIIARVWNQFQYDKKGPYILSRQTLSKRSSHYISSDPSSMKAKPLLMEKSQDSIYELNFRSSLNEP